jgi:ADP-ribosyl-[dinitrogen reductase] hydrolase
MSDVAPAGRAAPGLEVDQADRAAGVLMGMACGDALGAPYEFGPPLPADQPVEMTGGGRFGWEPGEWTDDTQMAVVILQAAEAARTDGGTLTDHLDDIARGWVEWARAAADVGVQTRSVLGAATRSPGSAHAAGPSTVTGADLTHAAAELHERTGRSGGNGSLMRTAPVARAHLHDELAMADAALADRDPDAGDACVIWCAAIRHAVLTGELDVRHGLALLDPGRRAAWAARLDDAERRTPADFANNGWVVEALQAAWCAIATTPVPEPVPSDHLRLALEAGVRGGRDADTVAAIAGALLGARWGASTVPAEWRHVVHGWPAGMRVTELAERGRALVPTDSGRR